MQNDALVYACIKITGEKYNLLYSSYFTDLKLFSNLTFNISSRSILNDYENK